MRTKLAALLLAVLLLTGCVPYVRWQITTNIPQTQQMPAPTPAPTAMPQLDSGLSRRQMVYGSAGLLTEPTVLVSVYLNDAAGGRVWTEDAKAETRQYLATAVQWLNEQAETYGRTLQLYYDDGTVNSPLCRTYTPKSAIRGGRSTEESDALLTELDAVSATLDTAALQKTYGTDRVAFLYFLPVSGASFTMVHYADDGSNFTTSTAASTGTMSMRGRARANPRRPMPTKVYIYSARRTCTRAAAMTLWMMRLLPTSRRLTPTRS